MRVGGALCHGHYWLPEVSPIPGLLRADPILAAEVLESRVKPGPPLGRIGPDAFGHESETALPRERARYVVLAMGRRDAEPRSLRPLLDHTTVAGMSSDHTVLLTDAPLRSGDVVEFALDYEGLVRAMTSPYVNKAFIEIDHSLATARRDASPTPHVSLGVEPETGAAARP